MFKVIKDDKIVAVLDTDEVVGLNYNEIIEDTEHTVDDYDLYYYEEENAEYLLKSEIPAPSKEYQSKQREIAYIAESDPISAHISYLQRKKQTPEIVAEIAQLEAEQEEIRNAIKERFPYYE